MSVRQAEPQLGAYAGQSAARAGLDRLSAVGYGTQPQQTNALRNKIEQNIDVIKSLPVYDFGSDGDAMNIQATQRGIMAAAQLAPMNLLGNVGGEHQKQTFRFDDQSIPRVLPPVFERRGVLPAMFTGDMQKLREIFDAWGHASDMELLTCCLTCGLSSLWICLTGCWEGVRKHAIENNSTISSTR
jgi:hypothetical protein